jgi:hypothetical protein
MRRLILWVKMALAAGLLAAAAPAAAQARDAEGLWALRADGRILFLLDLRRDPGSPGRWTGEWVRPEHFSISEAHIASDVSGPIVRRAIRRGAPAGDAITLAIAGRTAEADPDNFLFRLVEPDAAELRLVNAPFPPLPLARVPAGTEVASEWDAARSYALAQPPRRSNPEMRAIFEADQAARLGPGPIDWSAVEPQDRARRQRTRQLLDAGALQSGDDYWHAAFVFQHGGEPNDYLLAHTLALVAIARGRPDATWIAAATLDRYLQDIGQKQIYGTQYRIPPGEAATQEPYDRTLISDALREALRVPNQAAQEARRAEMEARARAREANRP